MGAVAEFELSMIKERQKEGIAIAKAAGKYKGNHKKAITPENREVILEGLKTRKSLTIIAEEAKICRTSLYEFIKILKAEGYEHPISYRRNNFVDKEWAEIEKVKKELQKNG
jgi:DNA invertase Pin-like site-specific DNA recombinase